VFIVAFAVTRAERVGNTDQAGRQYLWISDRGTNRCSWKGELFGSPPLLTNWRFPAGHWQDHGSPAFEESQVRRDPRLEPPGESCVVQEVRMSSKNENIKVAVPLAHNPGSSRRLEANSHSLLSQFVSILSVILSKRARFERTLEQVAIPACLFLLQTCPLVLLCIGGASVGVLWFAIPMISFGVGCGVLLFLHRSKQAQLCPSIVAQTLKSH